MVTRQFSIPFVGRRGHEKEGQRLTKAVFDVCSCSKCPGAAHSPSRAPATAQPQEERQSTALAEGLEGLDPGSIH